MNQTRKTVCYLDSAIAHAIEEVVMFGKFEEIDAFLDSVADDVNFPEELRNGLESLRYFREHYGKAVPLDRATKDKVAMMDTAWSMELLEMVRHTSSEETAKQA